MTDKTKHDQLKQEIQQLKTNIEILHITMHDIRQLTYAALDENIPTDSVLRSIGLITMQSFELTRNSDE